MLVCELPLYTSDCVYVYRVRLSVCLSVCIALRLCSLLLPVPGHIHKMPRVNHVCISKAVVFTAKTLCLAPQVEDGMSVPCVLSAAPGQFTKRLSTTSAPASWQRGCPCRHLLCFLPSSRAGRMHMWSTSTAACFPTMTAVSQHTHTI